MRRFRSYSLFTVTVMAALTLVNAGAIPPATTGNGAPSGTHYNLNIIGVPKGKKADMTGNQGHRIFVALWGKSKILLSQSTDGTFQVLDANATDGSGAFQLPAPGTYSVWARPLGKPGGSATMTTCATDPSTGEEVCSTESYVAVRSSGKSKFTNVTSELTTIVLTEGSAPAIACGKTVVSLFDACLQGYFWDYDNRGLKILQLRFYPA